MYGGVWEYGELREGILVGRDCCWVVTLGSSYWKSARGWLVGRDQVSVWLALLGKRISVCGKLEQEPDSQGASIEAEWATSHG